jgi:hypothetical protein
MTTPFFWKECPARGVGLTHMHDTADRTTPPEVCSFCGQTENTVPHDYVTGPSFPVIQPEVVAELQPRSITLACLHDHGDGPCTCSSIHMFGREARWIDGHGPQGNPEGVGRGDLSYRLKMKLGFVRWRTSRIGA